MKGTNTIIFITKTQVPKEKDHIRPDSVKIKTRKEDKERTRLTMGRSLLDFTGNVSAPTASVTTSKFVFNSVVCTPLAKCLLDNIKHFYLNNILPDPEFMRIPLKIIPQEIVDAYNIATLVENQVWIYMRIEKVMYVLKQASIIANQELVKHVAPFGYHPVQ